MAPLRRPIAMVILVGLIVAACTASPTTSPTPPAPSPTSSSPASSSPNPASSSPPIVPTSGRIAAGYQYTCVLTVAGGVKCWGSNDSGQLGNGTTNDTAVPGAVNVEGLESGVSAIAAGGAHACALMTTGGVKCWGDNLYGQLGNGSNTDRSVPVDVAGLASGVTAISAGWSSTCALTSGGGVKCWGNNPFGGLGDGTNADRSVPVDVVGLASGVTAISAGTLHTCALTSSGGVTCWGYGQSDDPALFNSYVPVGVPGLARGVTAIGVGLYRTCALKNDGGVTCWGPNYTPPPGESLPDRFVPVDVSGLAGGVAAIAVGESNACALTRRGGVACWGGNGYGQLGNLSPTYSSVPVAGATLANGVIGIAVGGQHICALTSGGEVTCWGSNTHGQLGNIMRCSSTSIPVAVPLDGGAAVPTPSSRPTAEPSGTIAHATGRTDVVLRFDIGPDQAVGELTGEIFRPGPEFTLYGDGTVIFRAEREAQPVGEGPIVRARPFMIAHLDEAEVQALLRFALGAGGLSDACERYETQAVDFAGSTVFTVHAGSVDKRVEVFGGEAPLAALEDHLLNVGSAGSLPTQVWMADRYRGNLLEAGAAIEVGVLPDPSDAGVAPWPWPGITPEDFAWPVDPGYPQRIMSASEASVLGLTRNGGVVQRIYLLGPGGATIYSFSMWPMLPDQAS
ncbi:MAG: hypothetical protein OEW24_01170 [Chloroflexota bacterium]|nr:hypothetical protein [Chloroflexota bacterium]